MIAIGSRSLLVGLVLMLGFTVGAQEPAKRPLSAGEVVVLSNNADPKTAATALKTALMSSDPAARAAAARVFAVTPQASMPGDLIGALAREQDPATGAEMVRDLLLLSGAGDATFIDVQVRRFGASGAQVLAEWLAREEPQEFAKREAELAALAGDRAGELAPIIVMAAGRQSSHADAIYGTWAAVAPPGAWAQVLSRSVTSDGVPASLTPVISDALDSTRQTVSEETVWFVLDSTLRKTKISPDLVVKASRPREGVTAWEAFGRELLARGSSRQGATDRRDLVTREGPSHPADIRRLHAAKQLTDQERDAVLAIIPLPNGPTFDGAVLGDHGHTVHAFVPGVIGSTLSAAGCDIRRGDEMAVAAVDYASDGRPRHISIDPTGLSPQCQAAVAALARTSFLPAAVTPASGATQKLMVPLNSGFVACADAPPAAAAPSNASSLAQADVPKKTKNVNPIYPDAAMRAHIQGDVIIEALITSSGCISSARVLRSIPALDAAALQSVVGWQFQPGRLNGTPVPVVMTVTVSFALR